MIIRVNNKLAVLKSGFSFDYVSENRLFLGRDGYSLNIPFPLKGCPENIEIFGHINRIDMAKTDTQFECSIVDGKTALFGTLSVVKISDVEVQCQFAEGRCAQTAMDPFEDVFITALDLGSGPTTSPSEVTPAQAWKSIDNGASEVALPWINENYPLAPNNWVNYQSATYSWDPENRYLSWQPYLIVIAKRICDAIGYSYDFAEWEASDFRHLIICNTLPGAWLLPGYASALPEWTVGEFFEKLELFMMCEFEFDHKAQTVSMHFSKTVLSEVAPVFISNLVDAYDADVSHDNSGNCEYVASKRLAYKECSHSMWPFYSCDWYIKSANRVKQYDTLIELVNNNKRRLVTGNPTRAYWGEQMGEGWNNRLTTVDALLYAADVDTYFVFRSIGTESVASHSNGYPIYSQVYVLQPVNVFGSGTLDDQELPSEEIEFVPVCLMDTYVSATDDKGIMMYLNPSGYDGTPAASDSSSGRPGDLGVGTNYDETAPQQPLPASVIAGGGDGKSSVFYDEIYLAFWDNTTLALGKSPYPIIDRVIVTQVWSTMSRPGFSMRLSGASSKVEQLPQIDPKQKFKFSWIASDIPNPRAIFYVRGKRYLCEKITATFTENGMSQLLKGEFYPLLDTE